MKCGAKSSLVVGLLFLSLPSSVAAQSPPSQPASGPGGTDYHHNNVTVTGPYWTRGKFGKDEGKYFLYEPADPKPTTAPVVLFLHAWASLKPQLYTKWIEHMVKKGHSVVWVQYQTRVTPFRALADNVIDAWRDALSRLDTRRHVRPARNLSGELNTAIVGHSIGAYLSAIVAALAADPAAAIPSPRAVVGVEPGGMDLLPFEDFGMISPATKMVLIVGDEDKVACKSTAVAIWENTPQIADVNRDLLLVRSDRHGAPAQVANHTFPNTTGTNDTAAVDARDFFVTFKLSVAALNCAFGAKDCSYAVGNGTTEQTDMGIWSDGVPLVPLLSVDDPLQMQTTCQDP